MKIYVVNGFPESGKTTFEEYCKSQLKPKYQTYIFSTITNVKKIAEEIGWDGRKTLKDRKFLSDLKDLLTEYNDYPYHSVKKEIQRIIAKVKGKTEHHIIFIDCREPEEIKKICKDLHAKSLCIRRPDIETNIHSNHADGEVLNYEYDYYIWNKNDLNDFYLNIDTFIKEEIIGE